MVGNPEVIPPIFRKILAAAVGRTGRSVPVLFQFANPNIAVADWVIVIRLAANYSYGVIPRSEATKNLLSSLSEICSTAQPRPAQKTSPSATFGYVARIRMTGTVNLS